MATAFQSNAFQRTAFQISSATPQAYAAFSTPPLAGRTVFKMVAYLLMAFACNLWMFLP